MPCTARMSPRGGWQKGPRAKRRPLPSRAVAGFFPLSSSTFQQSNVQENMHSESWTLLFGSIQKSLMLSLTMTCGKCWGKAWQQKDVNKVILNLLCFSAHRNQLLWGFGDKSCIQVIIQSCHLSNVHSVIYFLNSFSWGWLSPQAVSEYHDATLCHIKKDFFCSLLKLLWINSLGTL